MTVYVPMWAIALVCEIVFFVTFFLADCYADQDRGWPAAILGIVAGAAMMGFVWSAIAFAH